MAENSQLSGNMKNSSTGTSSTDASSEAIGKHENEIVPHKISNHDKLVQTMVMVDGEWINVNDTNDQANMKDGMNKVNKKVVEAQKGIVEAKSAADSAAKAADSAVSASVVNSDAITAQSEAVSEAKSAISSATAAIQQTAATAASDAAKIRADVAQVQSEVDTAKAANSASVEALKSDVSAAKQDLADVHDSLTKAQSAIEQNQKLINDSVAQINADITQDRKDIASAQQANADTAKQLDTYSKQATEQSKTIKTIQDKQDGFTATLADVQGNVSQVSDKVDGLSASLKDAQGNVTSVKAQADQLSATLTDHAKSIATLTASAKELSSTLEDADGRLSEVEQTAKTNSSTLADVQGDLSQVKQDATTLTATLKDAQGNISTLQQKADSVSAQLASAQGDIASLQTDVTGIKATLVSHEGDIHTLQADSKSLHDSMQDAQGDISTLKKTSTDVTSELKDHAGRISKAEQTASTLVNEFADQQGHLNRVEQTANGTQQTVANQQGQINTIKTDAAGIHETLTGQGNQIASINVTLSGLNSKYEGVSVDLGKLKDQTNWKIVTGVLDANQYTKTARIFYQDIQAKNTPNIGWFYLIVDAPSTSRITQTLIRDNATDTWTRVYNGSWQAWTKGATNLDVTNLSNRITTNSTQIDQNKKAITLKADQSTVNNLTGEVSQNKAQLKIQAGQISSKVSSTEYQTLKGKVDGMQIGGRNVLRNTDPKQIDKIESDSTWILGSGGNGSAKVISLPNTFSARHGFEIYGNTTGNRDFTQRPIHWTKNRYIFSIYAKIADGSTVKSVDMLTRAYSNQTNRAVFENHYKLTSSSWERVVLPIDASSFYTQSGVSMAFGLAGPGSIDFAQPMLEIATTPSMWSPAPEDAITAIQKNSTAIDQTNKQINLKADQKEVDQVKQTATQNSSRLNVMAGQISSKVTSTDVNNIVDSKGFATTNTVQSLVDQKASQISQTIANVQSTVDKNGKAISSTNDKLTNVTQTVDGLQTTVKTKADQSVVNQLSNQLLAKVSTNDYQAEIALLTKDLNLRVSKGDLISQINLEAGGDGLISVQNGKGKLMLDADSVVFGNKAFIPSAAITNIQADQITTGTLDAAKLHVKNFSADNISGGTLSGVTVKAGVKERYFQTSKDSIYWVRDNKTSLIGTDQYINPSDGLVIADTHSVTLTTWYGATIKDDGTITNGSGNIGYPKLILDSDGKWEPDASGGSRWEGNTGKAQIGQWIADREYTNLVQGEGFVVHLDGQNKNSTFSIQKDNCVGAYFGQGDHGNQINFITAGDGRGVNIDGNFHVTGSKNSIVETKQGYLAINAYETAEYYFGDIGESNTGSTSQVVIGIDRIFNSLVNTDIQYQVFVAPYSDAHIWVEKRYNNRFIVKSDKPNAEFGWELKAKRKGYESNRLRRVDVDFNPLDLKGETK